MAVSDREYFFARIDYSKWAECDCCWIWALSGDSGGYGQAWRGGKRKKAHRLSWGIFRGEIPKGMFVCHSCDNPRCVNPSHLFLGTHQDNMDDRNRKGRCARGEKSGSAKLSEKQVLEIRKSYVRHSREFGTYALARKYGVNNSVIHRIVNGEKWKHLNDD